MYAPISMDFRPITTPHLDLDHLHLADKDFQIKDTFVLESPIKMYCQYRDENLKKADKIGLWESNFPKYQFHKLHIFLEVVHYFHENYIPS